MAGIIGETRITAFVERRRLCEQILNEFKTANSVTECFKIVMDKYEEACEETRLPNEFKGEA